MVKMLQMSDPVALAAIAMVGSVVSALIGMCNTFLINRNKAKSDSQHDETKSTLGRMEEQTNGLTTALVKTTGDESFARGVIQGQMIEKHQIAICGVKNCPLENDISKHNDKS